MKIHYEELNESFWLKPLHRELLEEHRWYNWFEYVVEFDGNNIRFLRMEDSSECQDGQFTPAERYEADEEGMVEVELVEEKEVMVKKWIKINN